MLNEKQYFFILFSFLFLTHLSSPAIFGESQSLNVSSKAIMAVDITDDNSILVVGSWDTNTYLYRNSGGEFVKIKFWKAC